MGYGGPRWGRSGVWQESVRLTEMSGEDPGGERVSGRLEELCTGGFSCSAAGHIQGPRGRRLDWSAEWMGRSEGMRAARAMFWTDVETHTIWQNENMVRQKEKEDDQSRRGLLGI